MPAGAENVSDVLFRHAAEHPDAPAVVEGGATLSFGEFAALVAKATVYLSSLGVVPGMRVAVAMPNSTDHLILLFALFRVGAVLVEVPSLSDANYRAELVRKFDVRLALVEAGGDGLPTDVATVRIDFTWRQLLDTFEGDQRQGEGEAMCAIILSSGSTGMPKGALTTHEWLLRLFRFDATMAAAGIVSADRPCPVLIPLSVSYFGFLGATLTALIAGCSVVLLPKFVVPSNMIRAIASWGDAVLPATPDMCRALLAHAPSSGFLLPRLRTLISMGQPLFAHEKSGLVARVTPNLYDTYGTVGIGTIAYLGPQEMLRKGRTVGRPAPGVEAEIVDPQRTPLPAGQIGRLRARRPGRVTIFDGEPVPTGEGPDWFYPGEIACFDEDGYLVIKGRTADLVQRRGVEIFPAEIEEALSAHPSIQEAAVIDRQAPGAALELVAFIVKSAAVEHDEIVRHCADALPPDKLPNRIYYIDSLPRLGTGKLDRSRLRALAGGTA